MNTAPSYSKHKILGSTLTTMKVGGIVNYYARISNQEQIDDCVRFAQEQAIPYAFFGSGSNLLLADEGYSGLLMQIGGGTVTKLTAEEALPYAKLYAGKNTSSSLISRYTHEQRPGLLHLEHNNLAEEPTGEVYVEMSAGIPWGQAVAYTLRENLAGLQWYARIPCTVGGAVYNNIHAEQHLLSEVVCAIKSYNPLTHETKIYSPGDLEFDYDYSVFHANKEVITSVIFACAIASPEQAKYNQELYLGWTKQKSLIQPSGPSAGSVFKNISHMDAKNIGQDAVAAGWYIDQCGLKGYTVGGMKVYDGHANFIINTGEGTQKDFKELVETIRSRVYKKFQIVLEPEVELWDFNGNTVTWH